MCKLDPINAPGLNTDGAESPMAVMTNNGTFDSIVAMESSSM